MASTLLGGAASEAGADTAADGRVSLLDAWPNSADDEVSCCGVGSAALALDCFPGGLTAGASDPEVSCVARVLGAVVAASEEEVDSRFSGAAVSASSDVLEPVWAPPVLTTTPGWAERVTPCDDADGDVTGLMGDTTGVSVDPDTGDGAEADVRDTAPVPEVAAPVDESDDDEPDGDA